jgi:hypothetical protein
MIVLACRTEGTPSNGSQKKDHSRAHGPNSLALHPEDGSRSGVQIDVAFQGHKAMHQVHRTSNYTGLLIAVDARRHQLIILKLFGHPTADIN